MGAAANRLTPGVSTAGGEHMICPFCGKDLLEDQLFCDDCSSSLGINVAPAKRPVTHSVVYERKSDPVRLNVQPTRRRKGKNFFLYLMTATCALSLSAVAFLAGAVRDTLDPLQLQNILWGDDDGLGPPKPGQPMDIGLQPAGLAPPVSPVNRGRPLGDERENVCMLLRAASALDGGIAADEPLSGRALTVFLWEALRCAEPEGRFDQTPDGYIIGDPDVDDLCRETLGFVPAVRPPDDPVFALAPGGYEWRDSFADDWKIDIFSWEVQPDGMTRVGFNVLYAGMLYDSFARQGEALLIANDAPVYYRQRLVSLLWNETVVSRPSRITASSTWRMQGQPSYMPVNLVDGNPSTAWAADADGEGQWLELAFNVPSLITGVTVVNGNGLDDSSMRWHNRVEDIRIDCGEFSMEYTLEDVDYHPGGDYQSIPFGRAVLTDRITLTILTVYKGDGSGRRVCISEIELF